MIEKIVNKTVDNFKANNELIRIQWRCKILETQQGIDLLCNLVRKNIKEQNIGPHVERY